MPNDVAGWRLRLLVAEYERQAPQLARTDGSLYENLLAGIATPALRQMIDEREAERAHVAPPNTTDQIGTGDAVRFELPSDASASKWKRFVTTWLTVFPVLLIVSLSVRMVVKEAPLPLQLLPSSLLLTATLQWVILPRLQRHTRFWLLQDGSGHLRT